MSKYFTTAATIAATTSILAAVAAIFATPTAAMAADLPNAVGHYEWHAAPQQGPRAPLQPPVRVWVDASGKRSAGMAAPAMAANGPGHYEWRTVPQYGPRATLRAPMRTWVSDARTATIPAQGGAVSMASDTQPQS
ncbi:hypothetical protein [Sphingobium sp. CAP-1]|uniref:hypothetical protein n=1 Tax=Sphingobium sp. CAP-1 TaxID=2676077 RepID=UPI0012BB3FF4|nr:hypothetical protein [Sphingobium sp. CAP-1]QGP81428.1 hypothetical protein GL174_20145 [Sphingobium sp. CAP-1]